MSAAQEPLPGRQAPGPFSAPWQAQVFAMTVRLSEAGVFTWSEWAASLSAAIADPATVPGDLDDANEIYYRQWLAALESLLDARGILPGAVLDAHTERWRAAAMATPHGEPIELARAAGAARSED